MRWYALNVTYGFTQSALTCRSRLLNIFMNEQQSNGLVYYVFYRGWRKKIFRLLKTTKSTNCTSELRKPSLFQKQKMESQINRLQLMVTLRQEEIKKKTLLRLPKKKVKTKRE